MVLYSKTRDISIVLVTWHWSEKADCNRDAFKILPCTCSTQTKICAVRKGFVTLYTCSFTNYNYVGLTIKTRHLCWSYFPLLVVRYWVWVSCAVSRVCTFIRLALYQQWSKVIQDTSCYSCPGIHLCIKWCWLVPHWLAPSHRAYIDAKNRIRLASPYPFER